MFLTVEAAEDNKRRFPSGARLKRGRAGNMSSNISISQPTSRNTFLNAFCIIYNSHTDEMEILARPKNLINLCVSSLCKFSGENFSLASSCLDFE